MAAPQTHTSGGGTNGVEPFSSITAGTNTAALLVGAGGTLGPTSTGTIGATRLTQSAIYAVEYGVTANTKVVFDATWANSSSNVSCPNNDCNFVAGDVGKIVFGTNANPGGGSLNSTTIVVLPQGTITTVTDSSHIVVSTTSTASRTANGVLIWGTDDTTALANAWTATKSACSTLQLPAGRMLIQSASFNEAQASPTANCSSQVANEQPRFGYGVKGVGLNATTIIPTPSFDWSSCTFGKSGHGCLFTINAGIYLSDFTVWGGGNSVGSTHAVNLIEINSINSSVPLTVGTSSLENVHLDGWAGDTDSSIGLLLHGGVIKIDYVAVDAFGQINTEVDGAVQGVANGFYTGDSKEQSLKILSGGEFASFKGTYGPAGPTNGCIVQTQGTGSFYSYNDDIGYGVGIANGAALCMYDASKAYLSGTLINVTATGEYAVFSGTLTSGTGDLYASGTQFIASGSGATGILMSNLNFHDLGGNTITATTPLSFTTGGSMFHDMLGQTVASLPTAAAGAGHTVYVTDSTAILTEGQTCVGSGSVKAFAFSNGSVWKCF